MNTNQKMPNRFAEGAKKLKNLVVDEILKISSSIEEIKLVKQTGTEFLFSINERKVDRSSFFNEYQSARRTFARKFKATSIFPWIAEISMSFAPTKGGKKINTKNGFFSVKVRDFTEKDFLAVEKIKSWPTDDDISLFERIDRLGRPSALTKQERRKKILSFF